MNVHFGVTLLMGLSMVIQVELQNMTQNITTQTVTTSSMPTTVTAATSPSSTTMAPTTNNSSTTVTSTPNTTMAPTNQSRMIPVNATSTKNSTTTTAPTTNLNHSSTIMTIMTQANTTSTPNSASNTKMAPSTTSPSSSTPVVIITNPRSVEKTTSINSSQTSSISSSSSATVKSNATTTTMSTSMQEQTTTTASQVETTLTGMSTSSLPNKSTNSTQETTTSQAATKSYGTAVRETPMTSTTSITTKSVQGAISTSSTTTSTDTSTSTSTYAPGSVTSSKVIQTDTTTTISESSDSPTGTTQIVNGNTTLSSKSSSTPSGMSQSASATMSSLPKTNTTLSSIKSSTEAFPTTITTMKTTAADPCKPNPCQNEGTCLHNSTTDYNCQCTTGFTGQRCETDINECETQQQCNKDGEYCFNTEGSYECPCQKGFVKSIEGCQDVTEKFIYPASVVINITWNANFKNSSSEEYKELANATLTLLNEIYSGSIVSISTFNSTTTYRRKRDNNENYVTVFYVVYSGNGNLIVIKHCTYSNCTVKYNESFEFFVVGKTKDLTNSIATLVACSISNICLIESTTCNLKGNKIECECNTGFTRSPENMRVLQSICEDENECENITLNACGSPDLCHNTIGTFACSCKSGYYKKDNEKCSKICEGNNPCTNGKCSMNKKGNDFYCSCDRGWKGELCQDDDADYAEMKALVIAIGSGLGALTLLSLIAVVVACCARRTEKTGMKDFEITSAFSSAGENSYASDRWKGKIPRPSVKRYEDIDLNEEDERNGETLTTFVNGKKRNQRIDSYINDAFDSLDESHRDVEYDSVIKYNRDSKSKDPIPQGGYFQ